MAAQFDNLEDVGGKFNQTVCVYNGKPVYVVCAETDAEIVGGFVLYIQDKNGKKQYIKLTDPKFSYKDFNLGYANSGPFASWWYRKPSKQYQQGLRHNQLSYRTSIPGTGPEEPFGYSKPFNRMLENDYPKLEDCMKWLRDKHAQAVAFHRDFALSWDAIHGDYIIEYRAKQIGSSVNPGVSAVKLMDEYTHLTEALKEALP